MTPRRALRRSWYAMVLVCQITSRSVQSRRSNRHNAIPPGPRVSAPTSRHARPNELPPKLRRDPLAFNAPQLLTALTCSPAGWPTKLCQAITEACHRNATQRRRAEIQNRSPLRSRRLHRSVDATLTLLVGLVGVLAAPIWGTYRVIPGSITPICLHVGRVGSLADDE